MGGGGGGEAQDVVTYTNLIPTYIPNFQEWTVDYLAQAMELSLNNYTAYPYTSYAAQNTDETDGIAAIATRGRYGSTIELDGKTFLRSLYDGGKINVNTKLAAAYAAKIEELLQQFDEEILPSMRANYVFAWGGSEHNVAEAKASEKLMAKINEIAKMYYDDYTNERGLQQQGMAHATPYGLQCIRDMEMLRQAGIFEREYAQGLLSDAWARWNEEQILPVRNLDIAGNAIRTVLSTYRQQSTKFYGPSTASQIAGVALTGLSIYSMFSGTSMNPYLKGGVAALSGAQGQKNSTTDLSGSKATLGYSGSWFNQETLPAGEVDK